jgi:hypothetical protein
MANAVLVAMVSGVPVQKKMNSSDTARMTLVKTPAAIVVVRRYVQAPRKTRRDDFPAADRLPAATSE